MEEISVEDITDVTFIIHAKGKSFLFLPKKGEDKEDCKQMRIALALSMTKTHVAYMKPLEEIV